METLKDSNVHLIKLTLLEGSAVDEGVSCHVSRTAADSGGSISDSAVGVHTTYSRARVDTLGVDTRGLAGWAVAMAEAFSAARQVWVSKIALKKKMYKCKKEQFFQTITFLKDVSRE